VSTRKIYALKYILIKNEDGAGSIQKKKKNIIH
jgi:hypothetical protein